MDAMGMVVSGAGILTAGALSARWNWWRKTADGIPVLMYHKVGEAPADSKLRKLWVSTAQFERQMSYIAREGYTPIVFKDLYNFWDKQMPLPSKPVMITFDDGYANNYLEAFPVLRRFGFPATIFVVVQTAGWENHWHDPATERRIPMITWAQLKEMQQAGWEIGSHTMNHHNLLKIDLKEVQVEVEKSRQIIGEFLGEIPKTFAYPYGAGEDSPAVRAKVQAAGYRIAVGVHAGKWTETQFKATPYQLPRVFVRGDENMFDFHLQMTRGRSRL